ncbi:hypothetical protein BDV96DRAFT_589658 [Lophiotrema nucula]|uniref:Uncharacterized protein n=1 Tax=Lophiotrema nucula TaxID=690887 RepID=A0A6A5YKW9_9PLEO|nr:hypothetical protein BDV96DRAFT_589658 [Lophiotrema nucula]
MRPDIFPLARPWTPPEMDDTEALRTASSTSPSQLHVASMAEPYTPTRAINHTHEDSRPRLLHTESEPYTPTKASMPGLPRYPYTPDSARTHKTYTHPERTPLPPMPWHRDPQESPTSPLQDSLFSCLSNLEHLISTSDPNDHQMSFIVSKFEEISSVLSAPEVESKPSDEFLFDFEGNNTMVDSGIAGMGSSSTLEEKWTQKQDRSQKALHTYMAEVSSYIASVKKATEALKMRHEEQAQLNSILLEVVADLRRDLRSAYEENEKLEQKKSYSAQDAPREKEEEPKKKEREIKPTRWVFFGAVKDALDEFGDMFFHY